MPEGFLAWHPKVHEHFGERLFFFLLAIKSHRDATIRERLVELFKRCDVPTEPGCEGFCSYSLLGDFDYLLRVWLPPDKDVLFMKTARSLLHPEIILQFSVQEVVMDWRFDRAPAEAAIDDLDFAQITNLQRGTDSDRLAKAHAARLACWVDDDAAAETKAMRDPIKAFICLKAPTNATEDQLDAYQDGLIDRLDEADGIERCTVHKGVGFTWLLAKIIAGDFKKLATLLATLGKGFHGTGLFTSTYAMTASHPGGDGIRTRRTGEEQIYQFWPALHQLEISGGAKGTTARDVRSFIDKKVLKMKLDGHERDSVRKLLEAALTDNAMRASEALFSPTIQTEREVREHLLAALRRTDGFKEAKKALEELHLEFKSFETLPLGSSLQLARRWIGKCLPSSAVPSEFSADEINRFIQRRNALMHGVPIDLLQEWQNMAEYLLFLFRMRPAFTTALDQCLPETPIRE